MRPNPIVINLFAGPGAGKSTLASALFSLFKMDGFVSELVTEFAKDLTWCERWKERKCQPYVTGEQYRRMDDAIKLYETLFKREVEEILSGRVERT